MGDVYPDNMIEVHVRAYLYRWQAKDVHEAHGMQYQVSTCPPCCAAKLLQCYVCDLGVDASHAAAG